MLDAYLAQFNALIQAPGSPVPLITSSQATIYINAARNQVAVEAKCIRSYATLSIGTAAQQYSFGSIVPPATPLGVGEVMEVEMAGYTVPNTSPPGQRLVVQREWQWFNRYVLQNPTPVAGPPQYYAQYGQGTSGTLWFNLPDQTYIVNLDTVCLPIALAVDSDPEAIPYQWTDPVPFYAAWLGMMQEQRQGDADLIYQRYQRLMQRARTGATPQVTPHQYSQTVDPTMANQLGIRGGR